MNNAFDEVHDRVRGEQLLEATRAGTAPNPASPAGKSLLASYARWQAREQEQSASVKVLADLAARLSSAEKALDEARVEIQKAMVSTAVTAPDVKEETAQQLASGAVSGALLGGAEVPVALRQGYATYKSRGGRLTDAAWRKSIRQ